MNLGTNYCDPPFPFPLLPFFLFLFFVTLPHLVSVAVWLFVVSVVVFQAYCFPVSYPNLPQPTPPLTLLLCDCQSVSLPLSQHWLTEIGIPRQSCCGGSRQASWRLLPEGEQLPTLIPG